VVKKKSFEVMLDRFNVDKITEVKSSSLATATFFNIFKISGNKEFLLHQDSVV
jgi:hypothetical protein